MGERDNRNQTTEPFRGSHVALGHSPMNCEDKDALVFATDSLTRGGQQVRLYTAQSATRVGVPGPSCACHIPLQHWKEGVEHESYGPHCGEQVLIYTETNRDSPGGLVFRSTGFLLFSVALGAQNCLYFQIPQI